MELNRLQQILARVYTDAAIRRLLLDDWPRFAELFDLSAVEADALRPLSISPRCRSQLIDFGDALISKRWHAVRALLPKSATIGGALFDESFRQYASSAPPFPGVHKHQHDALAFFAHLAADDRWRSLPRWQRELLDFEAADLHARVVPRRLRIRLYLTSFVELPAFLRSGRAPENVREKRSLVTWIRLAPSRPLKRRIWPLG
ncbi:MAG: hypothetical protein KC609_22180 [Myxococcales bacterium]|nr:hypothetical protein [Myxococcales bacterium]